MTTLTNSRSCWDFIDLERDIIKRLVNLHNDVVKYANNDIAHFKREAAEILHRFLNSLPDGEIISDGYYRGFKASSEPRTLPDFNERVMLRLGDIYDDQVSVMSSSEIHIIRLMQHGGSWAERVYQAIPEVVDKLLDRATTPDK